MKLLSLLVFAAGLAGAHDLEENRATLVLRDGTHVSLALYLNYSEALHQALLPQRDFGAFLLTYSAMKAEDLEKELLRAQILFESGLQIRPKGSAASLRFKGWMWPDAKTVRSLLQREVMQAMVDGHAHQAPVEIRAEAVSGNEIKSLTVRLPREFQKVLVVSYRPSQAWADPALPALDIRF